MSLSSPKRVTAKILDSLTPELLEISDALNMNPNQFVNRCLEGCLLSMKAEKPEMPQIVELYRKNFGRDRDLMERALLRFVHLIAPNYEQIPEDRKNILLKLVAEYDGVFDEKARIKLQRKARDLFAQKDRK